MSKLLCASILLLFMFFLFGCDESGEQIINNYYTVSDSLTNPNVPLRVVLTNPSNNEVGPFSLNSLQPHVNVSPEIEYDIEFLNNGITQNGKYNRIEITFNEKMFKRNTRYMLTLNKGIRSESGSVTRENSIYAFDTGG